MIKEKKTKPVQRIALERIYRLVELAEKVHNEKDFVYSKKYLKLAKRIGEKYKTKIPVSLKQKYCKKCYSLNTTQLTKKPFLIIKCNECGFEKKYSLIKKTNKN